MNDLLIKLRGQMIVSCQSEGDDPFNKPQYVALFAKAAEMGGAKGIRSEGLSKIKEIKQITNLPIIGLIKSTFEDGFVRITGSERDVENLIEIGCDIIAIDGTFRKRESLTGPEFIKYIKNRYECCVLADVATEQEAIACQNSGADCISTTLSGYTPETWQFSKGGPDFDLISKLSKKLIVPLFAEGRINTPSEAKRAMELGAYAVISGTAITRPRVVTQWFVSAINNIN